MFLLLGLKFYNLFVVFTSAFFQTLVPAGGRPFPSLKELDPTPYVQGPSTHAPQEHGKEGTENRAVQVTDGGGPNQQVSGVQSREPVHSDGPCSVPGQAAAAAPTPERAPVQVSEAEVQLVSKGKYLEQTKYRTEKLLGGGSFGKVNYHKIR